MVTRSPDGSVLVRDDRIQKHLERYPTEFYPFVYAGLRRGFFAYRREFNKGTHVGGKRADIKGGSKGLKIRQLHQGGPSYGFFFTAQPTNEKKGKLDKIRVAFDTSSVVLRQLELGEKVVPKSGRRLAIPTGFARTKGGRTKKEFRSPGAARAAGRELVFIPRRGGRGPFLATTKRKIRRREPEKKPGALRRRRKKPKKAPQLLTVFVLVPSVTIRPQLGFFRGWEDFRPERNKRLSEEFKRYLAEVWGQK